MNLLPALTQPAARTTHGQAAGALALRQWAMSASIRLCDPSRPVLVHVAIEAFIASQALVGWVKRQSQATLH